MKGKQSMSSFTESIVEEAALAWFGELGDQVMHGAEIAPEEPHAERGTYRDVVLVDRLRAALARINPHIPAEVPEDVVRQIVRADGTIGGDRVHLVEYAQPATNDWLVVNQFTVIEEKRERRPDLVVFLNGLPVAVIELKNPADENATIHGAFNQLQTYQADIPCLFPYNALLVVSDGVEARVGALTAEWERFMPWRTIDGDTLAPKGSAELGIVIKGVFEHRRFLDMLRHFIVYEVAGSHIAKKVAAYHQFHAVNKAVAETVEAASPTGDRRVGVIWHTQGSGKSLSMVFYAGKVIQQPEMANPTLVVLTDRNDLDDQLFGTFARCESLLRQRPEQAADRNHLRQLLHVASGGVIFTTIQKFLPESGEPYPQLSNRRNVIVIADEAHRSQYDFIDGFARHMRDALPGATFIGFTGTPIEKTDASTTAVFGDTISVYDIQRSVEDGATVPIYYENRLVKLNLDEELKPALDSGFEEATETEELTNRERLRTRWAAIEAIVGTEKRI